MPRKLWLLVKIFRKREHAEDFLSGSIRLDTLAAYRATEDVARKDSHEGIVRIPSRMLHTSFDSSKELVFQSKLAKRMYVLCMMSSYFDSEWIVPAHRLHEVYRRYLYVPDNEARKFGEFAVLILRPREFLHRVQYASGVLLFQHRYVNYTNRIPPLEDATFWKPSSFKYEREYRVAFINHHEVSTPRFVDVSGLADIATILKTAEINEQITIGPYNPGTPPAKPTYSSRSWEYDL